MSAGTCPVSLAIYEELPRALPEIWDTSGESRRLSPGSVLWLLILRGASIEFRNHIKSMAWQPFWDFLFYGSRLLLAVFFGAALGNVVRGVPLDASGYFFEPLWTNFRLGEDTGILDWYTIPGSIRRRTPCAVA